MTQEDKELLLKDLCARLPYGVKIAMPGLWDNKITIESLTEIFKGDDGLFRVNGNGHCIEYIKPYLFPLENMTEEQRRYINDRWGVNEKFDFEIDPNWGRFFVELGDAVGFINWCYKNHFDYRGLIPMDLAKDATNLNIY